MATTFVCETCIEEPGLQAVVQENLSSNRCDYCGREEESPIACELYIVTDFLRERIEEEYTDPANELPYESAEGGYIGTVSEGSEILAEVDFCIDNTELLDDIADAFSDSFYCRKDYFGLTPSEYREAAWGYFKRVVKHHRRYTFWNAPDEPDHSLGGIPSAGQTLSLIARAIHEGGPLIVVPPKTEFWRVRLHDGGKAPTELRQFTPPPVEFATQPNRMSPAGIPMFYGSDDFETAVLETVDPGQSSGKAATGARFINLVPLNLLDLTNVPLPSRFIEGGYRAREVARSQKAGNTKVDKGCGD